MEPTNVNQSTPLSTTRNEGQQQHHVRKKSVSEARTEEVAQRLKSTPKSRPNLSVDTSIVKEGANISSPHTPTTPVAPSRRIQGLPTPPTSSSPPSSKTFNDESSFTFKRDPDTPAWSDSEPESPQ